MILKPNSQEKRKQTSLDKLRLKPNNKQQTSVLKESNKLRKCFGKYLNSQSKHVNKCIYTHHLQLKNSSNHAKKSFENGKGLVALQSGKKCTKPRQSNFTRDNSNDGQAKDHEIKPLKISKIAKRKYSEFNKRYLSSGNNSELNDNLEETKIVLHSRVNTKRNENFKTFVDNPLIKSSINTFSRKSPDLFIQKNNLFNISQESEKRMNLKYDKVIKTSRCNYNSISLCSNHLEAKEFMKKRDESIEKLNKSSFNFVAKKIIEHNSLK